MSHPPVGACREPAAGRDCVSGQLKVKIIELDVPR